MIAFTNKDGHLTVAGTAREWRLFLERLDRPTLERMNDADKAHEILIVASAVPLNGNVPGKRRI